MPKMTVHLSQSITGPLMNWTKRDWKKATQYMTRDDGTKFTPDELKQEFLKMHAEGKECFPIGDCDKFDFKKGCPGHADPEPVASEVTSHITGH